MTGVATQDVPATVPQAPVEQTPVTQAALSENLGIGAAEAGAQAGAEPAGGAAGAGGAEEAEVDPEAAAAMLLTDGDGTDDFSVWACGGLCLCWVSGRGRRAQGVGRDVCWAVLCGVWWLGCGGSRVWLDVWGVVCVLGVCAVCILRVWGLCCFPC